MKIQQHVTEALKNLAHTKLRSLLALLGILVGTASVVAMVSGGELAAREALRQFKSLGTDLLAVSINPSTEMNEGMGKSGQLMLQDMVSLSLASPAIQDIAPYTQVFHPVSYQGKEVNSMVLGVTDQFANVVKVSVRQGRFVSQLDQSAQYCVIGQKVYEALKQISYQEPLGKTIQIGNTLFTIVGVADDWPENNFVYADVNHAIMVPLMTSLTLSKYAAINSMIFKLSSDADIDQVEKQLGVSMDQLIGHQQLVFRSAKELIVKMQHQNDILTIFLGLIGSISLLVGGIGVMNIMLVSVMERRREIGIRRSVGATQKDISLLFLSESMLLSVLGGAAGVAVGMLVTYLISLFSQWEFTLLLWPACAGFLVSLIVGMAAGWYPAWQAAKLPPMEALRLE